VVVDTLDAVHLDPTTFEAGTSSHPYSVSISGNGVLQFTFNNINLLDSTNHEPQSHGFLKYKIRQRSSNSIGDSIPNNASIYFDFNSPIITNTAYVHVGYLPSSTLTSLAPICSNSPTTTLTNGQPAGGTYTGPGVTGGVFDANNAGPGSHLITYTTFKLNAGEARDTTTIQVVATPTASITAVKDTLTSVAAAS